MSTNLTTLPAVAQAPIVPKKSAVIQIGAGEFPPTIQVFFIENYITELGHFQTITTCGVRYFHWRVSKTGNTHYDKTVKTYWGNTISNPHDVSDKCRGRQVAFRRAFAALVRDELEISDPNVIVALYGDARKAMFEAGAW
jgi:molybdopterin synthase catalytic subunit